MDPFVQCHYCQKAPTNPLELVCRHSYCTDCLKKQIQNDKIVCPVCATEHTAPAASLSTAKADKLTPYLIGLHRFVSVWPKCIRVLLFLFSGEPYAVITDDAPPTIHAECVGCKRNMDLRTCFHCEKPLCPDCRGKHHESQKKDVDQSVHTLGTRTDQLLVLARMYQAPMEMDNTHTRLYFSRGTEHQSGSSYSRIQNDERSNRGPSQRSLEENARRRARTAEETRHTNSPGDRVVIWISLDLAEGSMFLFQENNCHRTRRAVPEEEQSRSRSTEWKISNVSEFLVLRRRLDLLFLVKAIKWFWLKCTKTIWTQLRCGRRNWKVNRVDWTPRKRR